MSEAKITGISKELFWKTPEGDYLAFPVTVNEKGTVKTFEIDKSKFQLMRENVNRWEFMEKSQ